MCVGRVRGLGGRRTPGGGSLMLPPLRGGHEAALPPGSFVSGPLSRVGVPQGVRETSRLAGGGGLTAAAMEPPAARGLRHGVPHRSPWRALVAASPWAGDCCGVGTSTAVATTTSGLLLPAGTGLFPGEST